MKNINIDLHKSSKDHSRFVQYFNPNIIHTNMHKVLTCLQKKGNVVSGTASLWKFNYFLCCLSRASLSSSLFRFIS